MCVHCRSALWTMALFLPNFSQACLFNKELSQVITSNVHEHIMVLAFNCSIHVIKIYFILLISKCLRHFPSTHLCYGSFLELNKLYFVMYVCPEFLQFFFFCTTDNRKLWLCNECSSSRLCALHCLFSHIPPRLCLGVLLQNTKITISRLAWQL